MRTPRPPRARLRSRAGTALLYAVGMTAMMCGASILPALPEFVRAEVPRATTHGVLRGMAIGLPAVAIYFREYLV